MITTQSQIGSPKCYTSIDSNSNADSESKDFTCEGINPRLRILHLMLVNDKCFAQYYEKTLTDGVRWSKLEVDPATMGDQGIYACVANNEHGAMAKNFKAEYGY